MRGGGRPEEPLSRQSGQEVAAVSMQDEPECLPSCKQEMRTSKRTKEARMPYRGPMGITMTKSCRGRVLCSPSGKLCLLLVLAAHPPS